MINTDNIADFLKNNTKYDIQHSPNDIMLIKSDVESNLFAGVKDLRICVYKEIDE